VAEGLARAGDFEQAMSKLADLDVEGDRGAVWWRTQGYLSLAELTELSREQRLEALAAARRSSDEIRSWSRTKALELVAGAYHRLGEEKLAHEALERVEEMVLPTARVGPMRSLKLAELAGTMIDVGFEKRARELLKDAEKAVRGAMIIEQPALFARVASRYAQLDDQPEAQRLLGLALDTAELLENARPRALAVVEICRSAGVHGPPLTAEARARLDTLYGGLGDPW
jgi:hypothetical protein